MFRKMKPRFQILSLLAALSGMGCVSSPNEMAEAKAARRSQDQQEFLALTRSLEARRVTGRQTITLTPHVTLHADKIEPMEDGNKRLSGRVFLDGSRQTGDSPSLVWPTHAYAEEATWGAKAETLVLRKEAAFERRSMIVCANSDETKITLRPGYCGTAGGSMAWSIRDTAP